MTPKERLKQIQETYCPTCRKCKRCRPFMLITMDEWACLFHNDPYLSDDASRHCETGNKIKDSNRLILDHINNSSGISPEKN